METHRLTYRHGDLTFHQIEEFIVEDIIKHNGKFVLAHGEQTNHKHVIVTERPEDLIISKTEDGRYFFELKAPGKVSHEEHKTIEIMPGKYEMKREREYDWFSMSSRKVID